jgi:hypothetical protein
MAPAVTFSDREGGAILRVLTSVFLLVSALVLAAPANAIINGEPDGGAHPYVGMLFNNDLLCSGSLVSPRVLVTAGHCTIEYEDASHGPTHVTFKPDATAFPPGVLGTPHTYPGFCATCAAGFVGQVRGDVGVVVLDRAVDVTRYASLPREGVVDSLAQKSEVTNVGYGLRAGLLRYGPGDFAIRYAAPAQLIQVGAGNPLQEFTKTTQNPSQGKGGICFGDSGGPVLSGRSDTVLAVHSLVTNVNCTGVTWSYRIDDADVLRWIRGFM